MPSKKHSKSRLVAKRKGRSFRKQGGFNGFNKITTKPPPDTSRIPWFPVISKTGTDA